MEDVDRRSALALGLTAAAAVPGLLAATPALAQLYRPDEGVERSPGVRQVNLSKHQSMIPGYVTVSMRDIVYQPGAKTESPTMANDMVCHCLEGELYIDQGPHERFQAKAGDVWSCMKGMPESVVNKGNVAGIMRVIDLIPKT